MSNLYLFPKDDVNNWNVRASRIYTNNNSAYKKNKYKKCNYNIIKFNIYFIKFIYI